MPLPTEHTIQHCRPPTDRGGPNCTCHECQGIHCLLPHPGHSHREFDHLTTTPLLDAIRAAGGFDRDPLAPPPKFES